MKKWSKQRAHLRDQLEGLLASLGPTDADVAATLAVAGVKGFPSSNRGSAMARYLNAVVAFDCRVAAVLVSSRDVTIMCAHWWVPDVVVPTPASVQRFIVRFDCLDFVELLALPADPGQTSNSEFG